MGLSGYLILSSAVVFVVIAQQLIENSNSNCKDSINNKINSKSEQVLNTIESITQHHKENEKNGFFTEAKVVLKNGFVNSVYAVTAAENMIMDGFKAAEKLLLKKSSTAGEALQKSNEETLRLTFDAGIVIFQTLGEVSALTNFIAKQGLVDTSRKFQLVGLEIQYQIRTYVTNLINAKISAEGDIAQQAINATRQAIQGIFSAGYNLIRIAHQDALKAITDAHTPTPNQVKKKNAEAIEAAVRDLDAFAAISEIKKAAVDSIKGGASVDKVNELKELLISSIGDLVIEASNERDYFAHVHNLADTDPSLAKDVFLKENKGTSSKIQEAIANIFLDLAATGLNSGCSSKKKIETAIRSVKYGNIEMSSGRRIAVSLTILGIGLPENVRSLVLRAAVESGRNGKLIVFKKIIEAAKISFDVL